MKSLLFILVALGVGPVMASETVELDSAPKTERTDQKFRIALGSGFMSSGLGLSYVSRNKLGRTQYDAIDPFSYEHRSSPLKLTVEYQLTDNMWLFADVSRRDVASTGKIRAPVRIPFPVFVTHPMQVTYVDQSGHLLVGYDLIKAGDLTLSPYLGGFLGEFEGNASATKLGEVAYSEFGGIPVGGLRATWNSKGPWTVSLRGHSGNHSTDDVTGKTHLAEVTLERKLSSTWRWGLSLSKQKLWIKSDRPRSELELVLRQQGLGSYVGVSF